MLHIDQDKIKEIADSLSSGMKAYYSLKSNEVISIPDPSNNFDLPDEFIELLEDIQIHHDNYFEFEMMSSFESFQIMEDFIDLVDDKEFRDRLNWALNKEKPFRRFKDEIEYNQNYRQKWFDFRLSKFINLVNSQIERHNNLNIK